MHWHHIQSQPDIDRLLREFPVHDAFVKEVIFQSPTYVIEADGTSASYGLPATCIIVLSSTSAVYPGVEFLIRDVLDASLSFQHELTCRIAVNDAECRVELAGAPPIRGRELWYRPLSREDVWSAKPRYLRTSMFDAGRDHQFPEMKPGGVPDRGLNTF